MSSLKYLNHGMIRPDDLLFLRWMRWPLLHAARAKGKYVCIKVYYKYVFVFTYIYIHTYTYVYKLIIFSTLVATKFTTRLLTYSNDSGSGYHVTIKDIYFTNRYNKFRKSSKLSGRELISTKNRVLLAF
jgi:hypothetical protein